MKQKRKLNKKSIRLLILILGLIVLVVSTSYAVFSIRHENTNNQIVSAGELELTYNSCSTMTTEMVPMSNEDGMAQAGCNVTVENTGSLDAIYKVLIYNNSSGSNHLSHDNLYVSIDNSTPVLLSTITKLEDTEKYNLKEDILLVGNTRNHNIKIWIKEDATTDIVGKSVNLIVDIEAVVLEEIPESYEYAYTGTVQEFTVPATGYYDVELWGAEGGLGYCHLALTGVVSTPGAYTKGTIYLEKNEVINLYIGQEGGQNRDAWNGGGFGGDTSEVNTATGGGGATDVRLVKASANDNTIWNESTSLRSRIMVSGGSGGSGNPCPGADSVYDPGGYGGNLLSSSNQNFINRASQISGYAFGYGGAGTLNTYNSASSPYDGGGGGGYYGGTSLTNGSLNSSIMTGYHGGGAGGSSYISGYSGVNSVEESGGTASQPLHTNNTIHYSGKYFIKGSMEAGINEGNGKAKITYIGTATPERTNTKLDDVRYIKSCLSGSSVDKEKQWLELQAIKDGVNVAYGKTVTGTKVSSGNRPYSRITDGDITSTNYADAASIPAVDNACITIDLGQEYDLDEISMWLYYGDGRRYNDNVLSVGLTNVSGMVSLSTVLHNYPGTTGYVETSQGKRYTAWD